MSLTVKRPTIEGMPSPAARGANTQDGTASPAMRLDVMRSLRKRPKLAASVAAGVFLLAFLFGLLRKPAYQAESLIYIEPLASKVLSDGTSGSYDAGRYDSYFQQQMQTALRPDILASAIDSLPPFTWRRGGESMQSAVTRLQKTLKVERVLTSYQLSISLVYASPEAAAAVVNAVTTAYLEQGRKDEHAVIDQRLKLLGEERQRIQQQLGEDRVEQASLGGMLGLSDSSGKTVSPFDAQIAGAETQVAGARQARDMAAAQYASVQTGSPALTAAAEEQIATDAGLNSMKQTISQRKALLSTQMAGLTVSNPIYKQDEAEIADLDRSLDAMTRQIREKAERRLQDKLHADLQRTADVEGRLNAELRRQTATATSSVPKLQRAQELSADITRLTARFTVVDDAMRSLELESNGPGSAHLSVAAQVPVSPNPSKRKLILALSLPLGCFAGLFAAVFANRMDPRIYSAPDVEQVLGFSPIGVLPARSEVTGRTMEEYTLRLAAGLQSAYRTSSAQSFVFTAASATMETAEFVREIARILETLGFKALVMDASSVLSSANRTQTAPRGGYRSSALVRTIEGTRQGFAAEELERLKLKYDLLLIDAPPLLTSAEAEYLVRCADATILIAESGVTVKTELYQSAMLLQHLNVAGVGAVLQELHLKDAEPAFRAAIEAVERLQRGRGERLQQSAKPEPQGADQPVEEVLGSEPEPSPRSALDRMEEAPEHEAVSLPAVAEPMADAAADVPEHEQLVAEPVVDAEPVHVAEQEPVAEEPDEVRPWRELLKRTPEPVVAPEPEPVVTPVVPKMQENRGEEESEPVIYFQDRLRAPRTAEVPAEPLASMLRETIHVERVPLYEEPAPRADEPMALAREVEAAPVAEEPESSMLEADLVGAEAFERTVFESGTEGHGQVVAVPEEEEFESRTGVTAEPVDGQESLIEASVEQVEEPEDAELAEAVDPVIPARPLVRRAAASPRMGWFTLKFRGTTERVLRVIPGDEGDEYEPEAEAPVAVEGIAVAGHADEPVVTEAYEVLHAAAEDAESALPMDPVGEEAGPVNAAQEFIDGKEEIHEPVAEEEFYAPQGHEVEAHAPVESDDEPEQEEAFVGGVMEEEEPVFYQEPSVDAERLAPQVAAEQIAEPVTEMHTPVKLRWTVRDLDQDELEQQTHDSAEAAEVPATEAEGLAPASLMNELRSRAAAMPAREDSGVQKHPSGRRSGAPVEERLEPRAASLTRRWEMLSRFDATSAERHPDVDTPKAGN